MDRHRFSSPNALSVSFPAPGRGVRDLPRSHASAGLSFQELRKEQGLRAALWSAGIGLTAAWLGLDRFNTMRFALVFCLAALTQFAFARAAYEKFTASQTEMHS